MPARKSNSPLLNVKTLTVGEMAENCHLVFDKNFKEAVIIDPGDEADYLEKVINDLELTPTLIVATHGHLDHVMAVFELKLAYNIPFYMNSKDDFLLQRLPQTAKHFGKVEAFPVSIDKNLAEADVLKIGGSPFFVIETPGHTPGSITLASKEAKIAFVGDLIFKDGRVGRYDFGYSDKEGLKISVAKILKLPGDTTIYPGHGEEFTVADFGT
ncbi:MAG: Beta-lactamase domain protein [Candidatus Woesebacteria bacterium GW2011_GWC2_45_9]|uniref:Beta-lactamase domain protein n=2 Tax=Microgenomates group TaxID=1794810 RepID=A0A0G1N6R8_9BACT|nr:MAG: Beta-lactamase domain protein [Candidatus Curtissbacteria bacterium GW2011_GWC1_44_33]KKU16201.1 MAG: Beta-lactamase domain protein [Candidatus Woesebacteria bacterium GW2011_GWC2_45_9]